MYAQVLLPLKLRWIPTYATDIPLHRGEAVKVVFAGRKYTGIVWDDNAAAPCGVKRVLKVLGRDEAVPALGGEEMELWSFVAGYYLCTLGEVFAMALPGMRLQSEKNASAAIEKLRGRVAEIEKQLTGKHCERVRLRLEEKREELLSRIAELSPATITSDTKFGNPGGHFDSGNSRNSSTPDDSSSSPGSGTPGNSGNSDSPGNSDNSPRSGTSGNPGSSPGSGTPGDSGNSDSPGNSDNSPRSGTPGNSGNPDSQENSGGKASAERKPRLLISPIRLPYYVELIRGKLAEGRQVLLLTPEVAFADRLEKTLSELLGAQFAVVHSGKSQSSRQRAAARLRSGQALAVLGTRSSIFLPFRRLGLVIIDDEQDPFYKQNEPAPRYNGRDCGVYLAGLHSADVILGSSCPSLETLLNLHNGKYLPADPVIPQKESCELIPKSGGHLLTGGCNGCDGDLKTGGYGDCGGCDGDLKTGGCGGDLNTINSGKLTVIDIASERRKNGMKGPISRKLIAACLKAPGRVLLIRGWEKQEELAECLKANLPGIAVSVCTLAELKRNGSGGTALIAVLQADALLSRDDFRSDERALQLVSLLKELSGEVIIQTEVPQRFSRPTAESSGMTPGPDARARLHEIQLTQHGESSGMLSRLDALLSERREFGFPPYTRIVDIRRYGECEILKRIFLRRDSGLAARKAEIFDSLPSDCYADVDPQ